MPTVGGSYGKRGLADETADTLKRRPAGAESVSYVNTKRRPRTAPADQHFGHIKPLPKP